MNVVLIIQARMGSSRLPGKVMLKLFGKTVLGHVIERCRAIPSVNKVIVASTDREEDNVIADECSTYGVHCFRGSENDVLARYYWAAKDSNADTIVRITSDCPLLDPFLSNEVICQFASDVSIDYCSNDLIETFPRGLNTEVFSFKALEFAYRHASKGYEREHVTPFIYENPDKFGISTLKSGIDYSNHRWTLDTKEDWEFIHRVYEKLYTGDIFLWKDVLKLVARNPDLSLINAQVLQKKLGE